VRYLVDTDQVLHRFLEAAPMIGIDPVIAETAADVRIELRRQQRHMLHRALDILIAATAIDRKRILVIRNYEDIPGLEICDP